MNLYKTQTITLLCLLPIQINSKIPIQLTPCQNYNITYLKFTSGYIDKIPEKGQKVNLTISAKVLQDMQLSKADFVGQIGALKIQSLSQLINSNYKSGQDFEFEHNIDIPAYAPVSAFTYQVIFRSDAGQDQGCVGFKFTENSNLKEDTPNTNPNENFKLNLFDNFSKGSMETDQQTPKDLNQDQLQQAEKSQPQINSAIVNTGPKVAKDPTENSTKDMNTPTRWFHDKRTLFIIFLFTHIFPYMFFLLCFQKTYIFSDRKEDRQCCVWWFWIQIFFVPFFLIFCVIYASIFGGDSIDSTTSPLTSEIKDTLQYDNVYNQNDQGFEMEKAMDGNLFSTDISLDMTNQQFGYSHDSYM